MTTFESLGLAPRLLDTLAHLGYRTPTPIQVQAIPPVLDGRDLLGCAQTGTGKTAAFALPIIEILTSERPKPHAGSSRRVRALVLAPTRELALQIEDSFRTYGRGTGLRGVVLYGGVKQGQQVRQLRAGVDVIVATPGRLLDLLEQGHVDLGGVELFVLDEADRMLDMGFIHPIRKISEHLPEDRQTLLFSATMAKKIRSLAETLLTDPVSVSVTPLASAAPLIAQTVIHVPGEDKSALLTHFLQDPAVARAVVFTRTKYGADKVAKTLGRNGVTAGAIHGNKSQGQRERALDAFRTGRSRVLVATDVAARGLDVDGITHVFNFNLPNEPEAYVHRIGRTGRAGTEGQAVSFCSPDERGYLKAIERLTGEKLPTTDVPEGVDSVEASGSAAMPTPAPTAKAPTRDDGRPRAKNGAGNGAKPKPRGGKKNGRVESEGPARRRKRSNASRSPEASRDPGQPGSGARRRGSSGPRVSKTA